MDSNNNDPLINKVAGVSDKIAEVNRDIRVDVGTNSGGDQVYLPQFSYSNVTKVFLVITGLVLLVAIVLIFLSLFGAIQGDSWVIALIWGLIFTVISIPLYFTTVYRENIGKELKTGNAAKTLATVTKIKRGFFPGGMKFRMGTSVAYTNPFPYIIVADWKDPATNQEYTFKSLLLSNDPSANYGVGSNINVYLDPANYKKYFVDTGDLV